MTMITKQAMIDELTRKLNANDKLVELTSQERTFITFAVADSIGRAFEALRRDVLPEEVNNG